MSQDTQDAACRRKLRFLILLDARNALRVRTKGSAESAEVLLVEEWRVRIGSMSKKNPTLLDRELLATVRSGMFRSQAEAMQEALGTFFAAKPQYRLEAALELDRSGNGSRSRGTDIAGKKPVHFRDVCL